MTACCGGTHANMIHTFFKNAFAKTKPSTNPRSHRTLHAADGLSRSLDDTKTRFTRNASAPNPRVPSPRAPSPEHHFLALAGPHPRSLSLGERRASLGPQALRSSPESRAPELRVTSLELQSSSDCGIRLSDRGQCLTAEQPKLPTANKRSSSPFWDECRT